MSENVLTKQQLTDFWISFADSVVKQLPAKSNEIFQLVSANISKLSCDDTLLVIKSFMNMHYATICKLLLSKNKNILDTIDHFRKNLDRWKKIDNGFITTGIYFDLISIIAKLSKNSSEYVEAVYQLCAKYASEQSDNNLLQIMKFGADNKIANIVDTLREYIDWTKYVKEGINAKKHVATKGIKFANILDFSNI